MMYEPFLSTNIGQKSFVDRIITDAKKHIQTLVRIYYLRHGFEAMDLFIVIPLALTAYDCIDDIGEERSQSQLEDLRSTLMLVVQGLFSQRNNHYLARALFLVIRGRMRPEEVMLLRHGMNSIEDDPCAEQEMEQEVRSHWPISVVKEEAKLDSHVLKNLVKEFVYMKTEVNAMIVTDERCATL